MALSQIDLYRRMFKYQDRVKWFKREYRQVLKASKRVEDHIVKGHIKIKARFICDREKESEEMKALTQAFSDLTDLRMKVESAFIIGDLEQ